MADGEGQVETFLPSHAIGGLWTYLQSIDWYDPWLMGLIAFHVLITLTTLVTRNHGNIQAALFLILLVLVYFSESINELAARNWHVFSRQQYFDSKGMFISLVFSVPILFNCMIMVANWLWQSSEMMVKLKQAQLRQRLRLASEALSSPIPFSDGENGDSGCDHLGPLSTPKKSHRRTRTRSKVD